MSVNCVNVLAGARRLLLAAVVIFAFSLEVTRARVLQLDECPVGCSSHGSCREGLCDCSAGWSGEDCSYFLSASGSGEEDPLDEEEECVDSCSGHGTCGGGVCRCDAGWGGLSCNVAAQCPETCRPPNGNCNAGSCVCAAGFFGPQCADALCPNNCFGHGVCNRGACECNQGWFGRLCDSQLDDASMCDPPCSNNGQCVSGQCYCGPGFTGIDCSMQAQVTPAQAAVLAAHEAKTAQVRHAAHIAKAAQAVHTDQIPQVERPQMQSRLHALEDELDQVQRQAQMLRDKATKRREATTNNKHAVFTQVGERGAARTGSAAQVAQPTQPQPQTQSHLDAVRKATQAAGLAAEHLRMTAEKELAATAKHRAEAAIAKAHKREKELPGYQAPHAGVRITTPAPAPVPVHPLFEHPLFTDADAAPEPTTVRIAPDADHEDTIDSVAPVDVSPLSNSRIEAELSAAAQALEIPGAHSMMVSHSHKAKKLTCEADCGGHGTCVLSGAGTSCRCADGWVGMLCDTQRCESDCNGRGVCLQGRCLCGKGWLGKTCANLRCPDDCSGVGYCFAGRCRCKTGYEGENCAKVKPAGMSVSVKMQPLALVKAPPPIKPYYEGMTLRAMPAKLCPQNCNGRGNCQPNGECACNVGYSGPACEMYCPNECSHNGDCIEGACLCFAGFLGVDCSISGCCSGHGSCEDPGSCVCEDGWDGDDCSVRLMCPDPACSGHGTCTSGKCHCTAGFSGAACALQDGGCVPPCGPSGACNPISHRCECAGGAAGPTCLSTIKGCPKNCHNRGLCMNGECMCGPGWMGKDCGKKFFAPGQKPPTAAAAQGGAAAAAKGGGGGGGGGAGGPSIVGLGGGPLGMDPDDPDPEEEKADAIAASAPPGSPAAKKAAALKKKLMKKKEKKKLVLAKAAGGMVCGEGGFCSGHGKCNAELAKCECEGMFYGDICERQHCPGFSDKGQDCYGHGMCQMGNCQCAPGWGMAPFRLTGPTPVAQACMDKVCPVGCGMHGECIQGVCVCQQGWQGPNCKDPQCPNDCAGHGQCAFQSPHSPGQCICNYGWGGAGCQRIALYSQLKKCPNDCSGNGLCMNGMCSCNVGFKGPDCSDMVCPGMMTGPKCDQVRCPNDCFGRGLCMSGMCACWAAYAGHDCRLPVVCQETCGKVCEMKDQEQACNACVGTCESSAPRSGSALGGSALGTHNPFEDLQSTLLQQNWTAVKPGHSQALPAFRKTSPSAMHRKKKSHRHREVYQMPEVSYVQQSHSTPHRHHTEVSSTRVLPAVRSVF